MFQTQLRNRLVAELKDAGIGHSRGTQHHESVVASSSRLYRRAVDSLIADHLKHAGFNYTLSIFLPEAGASDDTVRLAV